MLKDHTNMADIPYERAKFQEKLFGFLEELGAVPGDIFEPVDIQKLPHIKREDERLINRKELTP